MLQTIDSDSFSHACKEGMRVLMRVDFNVPLSNGKVADDTRIQAAVQSIEYLLKKKIKLILVSHLGRPKGQKSPEYSLQPVAAHLQKLLDSKNISTHVTMASDVIGQEVKQSLNQLEDGNILLLENVRFYKEETDNDSLFAKELASLADIFVHDAFGTAHRAHASTEGVGHILPSYAGFLMKKEVSFFQPILENPKQPLLAIVGGAKVSSKIAVLQSLLSTTKTFVIGGGMAYTFLKVQGYNIGTSLYEADCENIAKDFLLAAKKNNVEVILPHDHVVAEKFADDSKAISVVDINIPDNFMGMDIGPKTINYITQSISNASTIIWNGPMGVFEFDAFSTGTQKVAQAIADSSSISVVGGGDSVAAANKFNLADKFSHVSTGGGASLEFLEGEQLPGLYILTK